MEKADWNNTQGGEGRSRGGSKKLKEEPGDHLVLMGSGKIISQIAPKGLVDEYQLVVNPIVLGKGERCSRGWRQAQADAYFDAGLQNGNVLAVV